MKPIIFFILLFLISNIAEAGKPAALSGEKKSILFLRNQPAPPFATIADNGSFDKQRLFELEKKIHTGKSMTITGISMFAGGALVTTAAVGFSRELYNINYGTFHTYNGYGYYPDRSTTGPTTGAVMCYILGPGCLIASIPIIAIGAVDWSTGSFEKRMYMQLQGTAGPNGMGMKMTF